MLYIRYSILSYPSFSSPPAVSLHLEFFRHSTHWGTTGVSFRWQKQQTLCKSFKVFPFLFLLFVRLNPFLFFFQNSLFFAPSAIPANSKALQVHNADFYFPLYHVILVCLSFNAEKFPPLAYCRPRLQRRRNEWDLRNAQEHEND